MRRFFYSLSLFAILTPFAFGEPKPLETISGCTFIPTEWADGDSFQIKVPDGSLMTVRLYAADCIELHINDDTDARRLRSQRRYFGITEAKSNVEESIELAKDFGRKGAEFTARALSRPFAIHTRMHKAPGDGKYLRYYAFVETAEGKDLATELIRNGLARSYGVSADGRNELSRERYREILSDTELQAAKREKGIWAFTNWDNLPTERDIQRIEDEESQIAQGDSRLPDGFRLNPNDATQFELERLPGIGTTTAILIIEARGDSEFKTPEDLMRIPGIKKKTLDAFRGHLEFEGR
jgi:competence protein ComEA